MHGAHWHLLHVIIYMCKRKVYTQTKPSIVTRSCIAQNSGSSLHTCVCEVGCCCCCCCCCWLKIRALAFSYSTSRSSNVFTSAADVEGKGGSNTYMGMGVYMQVWRWWERKESHIIQHHNLVKKWPPRSACPTPLLWFSYTYHTSLIRCHGYYFFCCSFLCSYCSKAAFILWKACRRQRQLDMACTNEMVMVARCCQ